MFKTSDEADVVLKTRPHMLDGKIIDPKKAVGITKTGLPVTKKIFIGGVRSETSDDLLREYFSQYGTIHSVDFPIDHTTSKRRGFCFLEFDESISAEKAMVMNFHPVGSQTVEVKPAYTKEQQQALMARGMWPPQSLNFFDILGGSKPGNVMLGLDGLPSLDPNSQNALNALLGQASMLSPDATISTSSGQMSQVAAAALFYQTYLQYAMALSAASLVQNDSNEVTTTQKLTETPNNAEVPAIITKTKSPEHSSEKSPTSRRRSPRRDSKERRRRRRSSSEAYRSRRRRSPSGSRHYRR
ncbi:hypothetical protein HZS_6332 [Henneguya salminicola]|nr:hypothetical protein HZS_6332 [Henneguya salminicola]